MKQWLLSKSHLNGLMSNEEEYCLRVKQLQLMVEYLL